MEYEKFKDIVMHDEVEFISVELETKDRHVTGCWRVNVDGFRGKKSDHQLTLEFKFLFDSDSLIGMLEGSPKEHLTAHELAELFCQHIGYTCKYLPHDYRGLATWIINHPGQIAAKKFGL